MVEVRTSVLPRSTAAEDPQICPTPQPSTPAHRVGLAHLPAAQGQALQTWVQGALHFKDATGTKPCPICQVPATPKHVLWLCKWHRDQNHQPRPDSTTARRTTGRNLHATPSRPGMSQPEAPQPTKKLTESKSSEISSRLKSTRPRHLAGTTSMRQRDI